MNSDGSEARPTVKFDRPLTLLPRLDAVSLMSRPWVSTKSLLVIACFSRHLAALEWAQQRLRSMNGPIALVSCDFPFHHTSYYEPTMGQGLVKRFLVFDAFFRPDCLPDAKNFTIQIEKELIDRKEYPEARPLNLDPGLLQLGKFLLATTKDQAHRIYLRDNIFAEVTLRYQRAGFVPWPWTYADYQEPAVRQFLDEARAFLYRKIQDDPETSSGSEI